MKYETKDVYKDFSKVKETFGFSSFWPKLKYYDDSNNLVVGKTKDKMGVITIENFVRSKTKMYF